MKLGCKETDADVIPDDWDTLNLGKLIKLQGGYSFRSQDFSDAGVPVIRISDIQQGGVDVEGAIRHPRINISDEFLIHNGDFLIAMSGATTGKIGLFRHSRPAYQNQRVGRFVVRDKERTSQEFVGQLVQSNPFSSQLSAFLEQGAQPNVSGQQIESVVFAVPLDISEQRAIATALCDTDTLLSGLDQLIAKKRALKLAAMQQLLTGRTRLPGFHGEWEVKRLGHLGSTFSGLTGKSKLDFAKGNSRYITFMNIMTNVVVDCETFEMVDVQPTESQNRVAKGDILFNGSSETPEEVGMCAVLEADVKDLFLNSFCFGFRFRAGARADGLYLAYYFRSREGRELLKSLAQGAIRYNLSKATLLDVCFRVPQFSEQVAIASALSDIDKELALLEARRDKTHALKQAMMQELLTGKTRLVAGGVDHA